MSHTCAVVLAGGSSERLGQDKTRLVLAGVTLLDRVLGVLDGPVVVVGPRRPTVRDVDWLQEEPTGGGPLAGLAAGLAGARGPRVLLLAADLPFLTREALTALEEAAAGRDGAIAQDDEGNDQVLLSCWDAEGLRAALPPVVRHGRLRQATGALDAARVRLPGHPPPWWDCDTPEAWQQAQDWAGPGELTPLR